MTALRYLVDAIALGSIYGVSALGLGLIFGLMRFVNFAYGELITAGAYALLVLSGLTLGLATPVMVVVVVILALLTERVAFRPVRRADPMTLLVTSFALSYLLQNVYILVFSSRPKGVRVPLFFSQSISAGGIVIPNVDIVIIGTTVVLLVAQSLFLNRARLGLQMLAASEDFTMARLLGVRANRVIAAAFSISGVLAAAISFLLVMQFSVFDPVLGLRPLLMGFAGVIVGGMGSLLGATFGGFALGSVTILLQAVLPLSLRPFRDAFLFLIVIAFLLVRPQGLIPGRFVSERV